MKIAAGELSDRDADHLCIAAEEAARRMRLPDTAVLSRTARGVRAGQVVGILAAAGRTLEILPKIDGDDGAVRAALVRMLGIAWQLRVSDGELVELDTQRHDLLEILIHIFSKRLLAAARRGLPRRYVAHEQDLPRLRGRLNVKRQFTSLFVRPDRLACRYDALSENTPLNRVLKAAVRQMARRAKSAANARHLAELRGRFQFVGDSATPLREPVILDRTNAAFHDLHRLAILLLSGDWQSTARGQAAGFALLFPMNELFEAFIGRCLCRALVPHQVRLQDSRRHALREVGGAGIFALRPDAVCELPGGTVVVDSKWKSLYEDHRGHGRTLGVRQSDIYQMLAYGQSYRAKRLVLVHPWHSGIGVGEGLNRRWSVEGALRQLEVVTVDISRKPDEIMHLLDRP